MRSTHADYPQFALPSKSQTEGAAEKAVAVISQGNRSYCKCLHTPSTADNTAADGVRAG